MKYCTFYIIVAVLFLTAERTFAEDVPAVPEIEAVLKPFIENGELPGIVAVAADGERIRSVHCLVYADVEEKRPMKSDTIFWIASHSKIITRAAVMLLVDDGKLDMEVPITTYLPELNSMMVVKEKTDEKTVLVKSEKPITLRHLLSHTSGMTWIPELQQPGKGKIDCVTLQQSVLLAAMTPLEVEPGTKYVYSNQGINIAAAIVERVSGKTFENFLKERFFEPLGMVDTTFVPNEDQMARRAKCYIVNKEKQFVEVPLGQLSYPLDDRNHRHAEAAGGLFSTAEDLIRFQQMYANGGIWKGKRILSQSAIDDMNFKQRPEYVLDPGSVKVPIRLGENAGGSDAFVDPKNATAFIYLSQCPMKENQDAKMAFINIAHEYLQKNK